MRLLRVNRVLLSCVVVLYLIDPIASARSQSDSGKTTKTPSCPSDDSGLELPAGFCAIVFADASARHDLEAILRKLRILESNSQVERPVAADHDVLGRAPELLEVDVPDPGDIPPISDSIIQGDQK